MDVEEYTAVVQSVIPRREPEGKHERGPYVVTKCDKFDTVTFSLDEVTWKEKRSPRPGDVVVLSQITKKRAGWRADSARFFSLADEQKANSNKQTENRKEQGNV